MATDDRFDETISTWFQEAAPARLPERVLDATFDRTRGSSQHRGRRALLGDRAAAVPAFGLTVVVVLVAAVGFRLYADRSVVGDQRGAYIGNWETTDDPPDRSHLTMEIVAAADGMYLVTTRDDVATVCDGTPSTMTGVAEARPDRIVIDQPVYLCDDGSEARTTDGPPLDEVLRGLTFVHDRQRDVLQDSGGLEWTRPGALPVPPTESPAPPAESPAPSAESPAPSASSSARPDAEQIIAEGTLTSFAATGSGTLLTVWAWTTCDFLATDCLYAWRLGEGAQPRATGVLDPGRAVFDSGDQFVPFAAGDGFILALPRGDDKGVHIAQDGSDSPLSMACRDAGWSTPTEPGRLAWMTGLQFVDTVAGTVCPTSGLGGRPLANGVFSPEGLLWALVDNETGPETLTIGRYDGDAWRDHDFATPSGSYTSVLAAAGSTVVVLLANPEPSPQPDQLVGFAVSTDAGATWSEVVDPAVLERDLPFSSVLSTNPEDRFSGYTSMAFAGPSTLYVADGNGDLWRSTDLATFSPVSVPGGVQNLQSADDAVIARTDDGNVLVRISADGSVEPIIAR